MMDYGIFEIQKNDRGQYTVKEQLEWGDIFYFETIAQAVQYIEEELNKIEEVINRNKS